jgi:hypothetical protein
VKISTRPHLEHATNSGVNGNFATVPGTKFLWGRYCFPDHDGWMFQEPRERNRSPIVFNLNFASISGRVHS